MTLRALRRAIGYFVKSLSCWVYLVVSYAFIGIMHLGEEYQTGEAS
jgi:hypothetical protein